jgi:hypothetical protein
MKFKSLAIICIIALSSSKLLAQKPAIKFGYITLEEILKSKYEIDSTAEAIILYEKVDVHFRLDETDGFYIETETHVRKKILKTSALDNGRIVLRYYQGAADASETLSDIEAKTYNVEKGQVETTNFDNKTIATEKIRAKYYEKTLNLPKVKEGSIIEYKYIRRTPLFDVSDKPATFYFQGKYPKLWSEMQITIPAYLYYQIIMNGYLPLNINTKENVDVNMGHTVYNTNGIKYNFAVKNATAFNNEAYIASDKDYLTKIEFELSETTFPNRPKGDYSTTWKSLDAFLLQNDYFGVKLKKSKYLKEVVDNFASLPPNKEKLEKVYNFMVNRFEIDETYNDRIYAGDLKKVFENKKGTPSELNIMMIALLRDMDFAVNPIILSTRSNGKILEKYALLDRFNYTICQVELDGKKINLDVSDKYSPMGILPFQCLNGNGRLIVKDGGSFVNLAAEEKYRELESVDLKFDIKNNTINGKYISSGSGYYANNYRTQFAKIEETKFKENIKSSFPEIKMDNFVFNNFKDVNKTLSMSYDFKMEEQGDMAEIIYLNPMFQGKIKQNPFKSPERQFPIDFSYATDQTYKMSFEVPAGYKIESLPSTMSIGIVDRSATFNYACSHDTETNIVTVTSRINIKNPIYGAGQYQELKEMYNRIVRKHDEQIVLKHK